MRRIVLAVFAVVIFVGGGLIGGFLTYMTDHPDSVALAKSSPLSHDAWPTLPQEAEDIIAELRDTTAELAATRTALQTTLATTPNELLVAGKLAETAAELANAGSYRADSFAERALAIEVDVLLKHQHAAETMESHARAVNSLAEAILHVRHVVSP